ncbi:MAG: polysaccharide deacetylase family protein [Patescibacteria group bacterium]|nr:polysaccharide deacetylase family protein [Patescibacteria group bacterium]
MCIITTSWDDGDALDMRVAQTLDGFGVKGTFYIPRCYGARRISEDDIRSLAKRHEIGSHTLTHPDMTTISREQKHAEAAGSKEWLEGVTGKSVEMFCYPGGQYDEETIEVVREAGYKGARTAKAPVAGSPFDPYRFGVSLTFFPRPFTRFDYALAGYRRLLAPIAPALPVFISGESWQKYPSFGQHIIDIFEEAHRDGGIFHLYGHSWANTRYGMWPLLERVLKHIGGREDCEYMTNGEVVERLSKRESV